MWVTPAFAQSATGAAAGGTSDLLVTFFPFVLIFVVAYFVMFRPQRQMVKRREEALKAIRRGDTVVTGGGIIGKVTKVIDENELEVQIADAVRVRIQRGTISEVRAKAEPVAGNTP